MTASTLFDTARARSQERKRTLRVQRRSSNRPKNPKRPPQPPSKPPDPKRRIDYRRRELRLWFDGSPRAQVFRFMAGAGAGEVMCSRANTSNARLRLAERIVSRDMLRREALVWIYAATGLKLWRPPPRA